MSVTETARIIPFNRYGEVLVGQRAFDANSRPGELDFLGGGCEPDELPVDAAVRELEEETGVDVGNLPIEHVVTVVDIDGSDTFVRNYFAAQVGEFPRRLELSEPIGAVVLPSAVVAPALKFPAHHAAFEMALAQMSFA